MRPLVAIVGRPNVGKSTLFNRLIKQNKAITHDRPGVTRDRLYGQVRWGAVPFDLVDTGGIVLDSSKDIEERIFEQVREAVEAAQLILFTVDGREGLISLDEQVSEFLRQSGKQVRVVVNKVDGAELETKLTSEFYQLGFPLDAVSASHGYGLADLLESIEQDLPPMPQEEPEAFAAGLKLALVGRPNVGKSSLINAFLGKTRLMVSPEAGTTRDSIDVEIERQGRKYVFLDTAGVRRRTRITDSLERFSVLRSLKSSKRAGVTIYVLDALEGVVMQDKKLLSYMDREKTPLIVAVNKVDLVPREKRPQLKRFMEEEMRFMRHVPLIYTSAVTKAGLGGLLPLAEKLWEQCNVRITTGQLNRLLRNAVERYQPPMVKRRRAKFYYLTQPETGPPTFVFFVNDPALVKPQYTRYMENQIRKSFGLTMAPVRIVYRPSHDK